MKFIHLIAGLAFALLPSVSPSAFADNTPEPLPPIVTGENDVPGDFDEDGRPDLLWQDTVSRDLGVWLLSGFKPRTPALLQSATVAHGLVAVGTDDFNGDDHTDAVLWNPVTGTLVFWFLDSLTVVGFDEVPIGLRGHRPASILDFNRDGNPDVVFQGQKGTGEITVLLFNGTTVIAKEHIDLPSTGVDLGWQVAGSGDFDRDGDADLVLTRGPAADGSRDSAFVAVALLTGHVGSVVEVTSFTDRNWVIGAVADFSGDGWPDIFFDNVTTGETGAWEMRGVKIAAAHLVTAGTTSRRAWRMVGPR